MELWELRCCIEAYNRRRRQEAREQISVAWQTANFVGAAFAGKLRKLSHYLKDDTKIQAPAVSRGEFDERLRRAKAAAEQTAAKE